MATLDTEQPLAAHPTPENIRTDELMLNMGPQHPSTHGVLRVLVTTDGEIVKTAHPEIGYLHRCFEKHCEAVDYGACIPFVDRLDYLASMNNEMGFAIAVEKMISLEVPRRAEYIRVIISELQRIASHLMAFGTYVQIGKLMAIGDDMLFIQTSPNATHPYQVLFTFWLFFRI